VQWVQYVLRSSGERRWRRRREMENGSSADQPRAGLSHTRRHTHGPRVGDHDEAAGAVAASGPTAVRQMQALCMWCGQVQFAAGRGFALHMPSPAACWIRGCQLKIGAHATD
jgi:hypothetical protein